MLPGTLFSSKTEAAETIDTVLLMLLLLLLLLLLLIIIIITMKSQIKETRGKETEIFEVSENQL